MHTPDLQDESALDALLGSSPFDVRALVLKADWRMRHSDPRAAVAFYQAALRAAGKSDRLDPSLVPFVEHAQRAVQKVTGGFETYLDAALDARGWTVPRRPERFQHSVDILTGRRSAQIQLQRPGAYFYPDLPQRRYYERSEFAWAAEVEATAPAMRAELDAWTERGGEGFRPYMLSDTTRPRHDVHGLVDNPDWSTLYLWENGAPLGKHVAHFPHTYETIMGLDLPRITTRAPSILLSRLSAGAHIPPHAGVMNARLICHLPLIVPPGCGFRVGGEVREWREGELLVFDDSVEHEAWNHGDRDRVILIFDIWRPELSLEERAAVTALFEAVDAYR